MLSEHKDFLIQFEQYRDLLREAENERLIQLARGRSVSQSSLFRQAIQWLGSHILKWGLKLPVNRPTTSTCCGDCCPV